MTNKEYQQRRDAIVENLGYERLTELRDEAKQAIDNLFLELIEARDHSRWAQPSYFEGQSVLRQELRNIIKGDGSEEV